MGFGVGKGTASEKEKNAKLGVTLHEKEKPLATLNTTRKRVHQTKAELEKEIKI